ncbi:MAG: HRDC domain-containing protein [Pseudomonadales bacterium]|nr:HRDC domain-containing protein [Pseudomonadales bacterium]
MFSRFQALNQSVFKRVVSSPLITTDADLDACVGSLGQVVGIDTEFIRVRTFYPIPALYQLAGDGGVALVDAQCPATFDSLKTLLQDPARTKVIHGCSEDLEVMATHLDVQPVNLVDTQLAHAFVVPEFSPSYAKLVEHYLGLTLGKHETRSDWLQRPLSHEQVSYAREDVAYLKPIWQRQSQALAEAGRLEWFLEEMQQILDAPVATPDTWFETMKGVWRLDCRERTVLRTLVRWREREARRRDIPRAYTVRDEHLVALARCPRLEPADVASLLPRRTANRYGKILAVVHRQGLEDRDPVPKATRPLGRRDGEVLKALRNAGRRESNRLGIAPELLARKRELEADVRYFRASDELPRRYREGWRRRVVGDIFTDILSGES